MKGLVITGRWAAVLAICACAPPPPPGPVVSPTGIVYEIGTLPFETQSSQTATLYLRQDRVGRALEIALEGIAADSTNPIHYFLAGVASARLNEYERAHAMFTAAQRLYPAYELEIEPEREAAWGFAFNAGLEMYEAGDVEGTIDVWTEAILLYDLRPEAHRNLAGLLTLEGRYPDAIDVYRRGLAGLERRPATRILEADEVTAREEARIELEEGLAQILLLTDGFAEAEPLLRRQLERDPASVQVRADLAAALSGQGRNDEAREIYSTLLSEESLAAREVFNLGVGLFRAADFLQAAVAFLRLTELQPNSRDAWFNYANSLFAAEAWQELATAAERLVELDPLGENTGLITARARLEIGDREGALASLSRTEQSPVYLEGLQMRNSGATTSVQGRITGNVAEPGTPIAVRFAFYDDAGSLMGVETLTLEAPVSQESADFEVAHPRRAAAYRYELLN